MLKIGDQKIVKLVKTVKIFHRKNETDKKVLKSIKIPKSPLKSVIVPQ